MIERVERFLTKKISGVFLRGGSLAIIKARFKPQILLCRPLPKIVRLAAIEAGKIAKPDESSTKIHLRGLAVITLTIRLVSRVKLSLIGLDRAL